MPPKVKEATPHTIYLTAPNRAKVEKYQEKLRKEMQMKVSFNAAINKILENVK